MVVTVKFHRQTGSCSVHAPHMCEKLLPQHLSLISMLANNAKVDTFASAQCFANSALCSGG